MIETYNEDTTQKTNFWILVETFKYTIYILQVEQPVPRLQLENLMAQYTNETTEAKKFKDTENFFNVRPSRSVVYFKIEKHTLVLKTLRYCQFFQEITVKLSNQSVNNIQTFFWYPDKYDNHKRLNIPEAFLTFLS